MSKDKYISQDIKNDLIDYLTKKTPRLMRRATTDCVECRYLSENLNFISHDPYTYIQKNVPVTFPPQQKLSKGNITILADNCRESRMLENVEQTLIKSDFEMKDDSLPDNVNSPVLNNTLDEINFILSRSAELVDEKDKVKNSKIPVIKIDTAIQKVKAVEQRKSPRFKIPINKSAKKVKYDHIVSPVAALIHKTPQSLLKTQTKNEKTHINPLNLTPKTPSKSGTPSTAYTPANSAISTRTYTPAKSNIPIVAYTPGKCTNYSIKENIDLPKSIEKHMGDSLYIKKHAKTGRNVINTTLNGEDLTLRPSLLNQSANESFITVRKKY